MFNELDPVTLTAHIAPDRLGLVPKDSPLRENGGLVGGLMPGDTGTIVHMYPAEIGFMTVEFVEPGGYMVALADILPSEARPFVEGDISRYRFWKEDAAVPQ